MNSNLEYSFQDFKSLTAVIHEMGKPFMEENNDLVVLDTKEIMNKSVVGTIRKEDS